MFENLINKLKSDKYITLEVSPSHSAIFQNTIDKIKELDFAHKIDGFTITDNPLAKLKYNAILASIKLQNEFKKPVIATMSMRDKNIIALQSDILGANEFDIRAFLMVTGDPAKMSDQPNAKGVFEADSTMLLNIVKYFNAGIDYAGKQFLVAPKKIYPFAVSNAYSKNFKNIQKKIYKKIQNGAVGIITQPVYDIQNAQTLIDVFNEAKSSFKDERANSQLILGLFPITKLKTAQFLSSHVPGIHVPSIWTDKLFNANKLSEEEEKKVGLELSVNLFKNIMSIHPKVHIMTANRFDIAKEIIEH